MKVSARIRELLTHLEFGDVPLLIYFVAFIRQYFWLVTDNYVAWSLTVVLAMAGWLAFLQSRPRCRRSVHWSFWLIVALPLAFIFSTRVAYPDTSFDVLNYHMLYSERAMNGLLNIPGEMFPGLFPDLNPTPDMITGISRWLLGYRLGVVINFVAVLWAGMIIDRILRAYFREVWLRSLCILSCVAVEQVLAEINNYMVDLLVLPLLLELTWMLLEKRREIAVSGTVAVRFSLLLGMSLTLKLTNLAFVIPLGSIFIFYMWQGERGGRLAKKVAAALAAFAAPLLPWTIYLMWRFDSPIFPLYNKVFHSPYWPAMNYYDGRWGPKGIFETIVWPVLAVFEPERVGELLIYSGRASLAWIVAVIALIAVRKNKRITLLSALFLVSAFLWSASTGYIRYGLYLDLLGSVLVLSIIRQLTMVKITGLLRPVSYGMAAMLTVVLVVQGYYAGVWSYDHEWSGRPNCFSEGGCRSDLAQMLLDRSLTQYEDDDQRALFANVGVWVETASKTSAMMVMLRPDAPGFTYLPSYYDGPASRDLFASALALDRGKRFFSLIIDEESSKEELRITLQKLGFSIRSVTPVKVRYFAWERPIGMLLIELDPPPGGQLPTQH